MKQFGLFLSAFILFSAGLFGTAETTSFAPNPTVQLEVSSIVEDYWFIYDQSEHQAIVELPVCTSLVSQSNKLAFDTDFNLISSWDVLQNAHTLLMVDVFPSPPAQSYLFKILFPFHWFS